MTPEMWQLGVIAFLGVCYCGYAIASQIMATRRRGEYERILKEIYVPIIEGMTRRDT